MAKWWENVKRVKYSKKDKRFFGSFDMAEAKRAESIVNSQIKRGEIEKKGNAVHSNCTCGASGCIAFIQYENR